ncbi:lactate utilization protein C [Bacillus tianshenii]|uniref:LutC/YkgG family protein n=1 Tax=Sutcliffiella tianshenii TaxID=1463404 RepID=UPI001CD1D150|nr:lactate utilization protein C [Bacillus tianshenii]MCA1318633.1 lactate utilization protein C [Bacillus tianshenii]
MNGTIHNRDAFLSTISTSLGRPVRKEGVVRPSWKHQPQWKVLKDATQDELVEVLKKQCGHIHTDIVETGVAGLPDTLKKVIDGYGGGQVITWDDPRFEEFGLKEELASDGVDVHVWDPTIGEENIAVAERSNVGITFSDQTLAESGTVVLFSGGGKGRSVSLLPATYIAIIPKSTIVPRFTQAAHDIHNRVADGEKIPSCINFISGPSNSADIEMNLVVGVHGPIKAFYIVVEDK